MSKTELKHSLLFAQLSSVSLQGDSHSQKMEKWDQKHTHGLFFSRSTAEHTPQNLLLLVSEHTGGPIYVYTFVDSRDSFYMWQIYQEDRERSTYEG